VTEPELDVTEPALDAQALAERRRRRLWLAGASTLLVAVLVAVAIAVGGSDNGTGSTTGKPVGTPATLALYRGIPQRGTELGRPDAPVTLIEFADLQCPFCGQYARDVLPEVVRRYVRTGRIKITFRNLAFLGEDSARAAQMAGAASLQNKLYQFVDLLYHNQGAENTGWVTDAYLRRIATAVGVDADRAFRDRDSAVAKGLLEIARRQGKDAKVPSTPWFLVQRAGRPASALDYGSISVGSFTGALDRALGGK
jgi:protein-disulfide isomerase